MSFELKRRREQPDLRATLEEYQDTQTGMKHIHLRRDDAERGFVLMFPTPPANDQGIPHILEHLSLCGSERYDIRNPFFAMQNRSMASFMNAMTGADYTLYPFATTNEKDYWNLMGVYADATFFPDLHPSDFRQEGWRPTLVGEEGNERVEVQGVVFNEMMGALNGRGPQLEMAVDRIWYQGTHKQYNYGGDPLSIPDLKYEDLKKFHEDHYHPSRAIMLTYGDFDAEEAQSKIEELVLGRQSWEVLPPLSLNHHQVRTPQSLQIPVPVEGEAEFEHSLMLRWQVPFNTVEDEILGLAIHSLLFSAGSDFASNIIQAQLGHLGNCLFSNDGSESFLQIELQGLTESDVPTARYLIEQEIKKVAQEGFTQSQVDATLRDFEFQQRSTGKSGGLPFGVVKLYELGLTTLFNRDPEEVLLSTPKLNKLRKRLSDPNTVMSWIDQNLNRAPDLSIHGVPDEAFTLRLNEQLQARLDRETQSLTANRKQHIRRQEQELLDRQNRIQNPEALPGVKVADMASSPLPDPETVFTAGTATTPAEFLVTAPTNGQAFLGLNFNLNALPKEDIVWVNLLMYLMDSLGVEGKDWVETAKTHNQSAALISTGFSPYVIFSNEQALGLEATIQVGGLQKDAPQLAEVLWEVAQKLRLDEFDRMDQLVAELADRTRQSLSSLGDNWSGVGLGAMVNPRSALQEQLQGRSSFKWIDEVAPLLSSDEGRIEIYSHLKRAYEHLKKAPVLMLAVSDNPEETIAHFRKIAPVRAGWETPTGPLVTDWTTPTPANEALVGKTGMQYMRQVWKAPLITQPGAGDLSVLSKVMTMDYMLTALRQKGGAYGTAATYVPTGAFILSTYRDPRLGQSLEDFEKARQWVLDGHITKEQVDAAIVMVCRGLDAPLSPVALSNGAWINKKSDTTREQREAYRQQVLSATPESLMKAAERFLAAPPLAQGGFISDNRQEEAVALGLTLVPLDPQEKVEPQRQARMKV